MTQKNVIAIDLGGTKMRVALVSRDGRILSNIKHASDAGRGKKQVIRNMERSVELILEKSGKKIENIYRPLTTV